MKATQKALIISSLLGLSSADQPVHCLREHVYGEWEFQVGSKENVNMFQAQEVCTHKLPNRIQFISKDHQFEMPDHDTWKLSLKDNYVAEATKCKGDKCEQKVAGKWSPVYAQSLVVELENGLRFVSNFRYNIKEEISKDPLKTKQSVFAKIESGAEDKFDSQCGQTMVGIVQDKHTKDDMKSMSVQCFSGKQTKKYDVEQSKEVVLDAVATKKSMKQAQIVKRTNLKLESKPSDTQDLLISVVNENNLGWKADTCQLTKGHSDHKCTNEAPTMLAQTESKVFGNKSDPQFVKALEKAQHWKNTYKSAQEIPDDKLPETFDLRNINGFNFTGKIRNQSKCGSCYTFAFVQALESRMMLKYGQPAPEISPQQIMQCNFLNEGCAGGWPHMNGYFMEHGYMVSEECAPYAAKTKGHTCSQYEKCKPVAKVENSYFVGGGWGQVSEKQIMKEVLRNGAVSVEFQANKVFGTYKEGILSEQGVTSLAELAVAKALEQVDTSTMTQEELGQLISQAMDDQTLLQLESDMEPVSDKTMESMNLSWVNQNHSVLIVGWGYNADADMKYWIIRNSYSAKWGMKGDFLMKRGSNDFGIEADIVAFDPVEA